MLAMKQRPGGRVALIDRRTGDMLAELKVISNGVGWVRLGIDAEEHIQIRRIETPKASEAKR